jgi:hypothetical protein
MKHSPLLLLFICLLSFANCKKKDNRNYSYWQVNQDKFSSNNVKLDIGKAITVLSCSDNGNNFNFTSLYSHFYTPGIYPLKQSSSYNPDSVGACFYYKGKFFIPMYSGYLVAASVNGKIQCTLAPTWFSNYYDTKDSVLINGTFNEP